MSFNYLTFYNKSTKDKSKHIKTNIRNNQSILLTQLKYCNWPTTTLSTQSSKSKNNYSANNIYKSRVDKRESSNKEKDEIIKQLKEKIKELESKIKLLELKVNTLTKAYTQCPSSSKNLKNHSINGKETINEKKRVRPIFAPKKKKYSLKVKNNKKMIPSQLLIEDNISCVKERFNTLFNNNSNINIKSKNKNKNKAEFSFDKKKPNINCQNICQILKKAVIRRNYLKKNSKHLNNDFNELDLKSSISKLVSKMPNSSRYYLQTESNVNLSSKITSSTTYNYYKQNNSNNFSDNNNLLSSNNKNIYTEEGDTKDECVFNYLNNINNDYINNNVNENLKKKLNSIKLRTTHLLELFTNIKTNNKKI